MFRTNGTSGGSTVEDSAAAFTTRPSTTRRDRYTEIRQAGIADPCAGETPVDVLRADWSLPDPALATAAACRALRGRVGTGHDPRAKQFGRIDEVPMREFGIEDILGGSGESFAESDAGQARVVQ